MVFGRAIAIPSSPPAEAEDLSALAESIGQRFSQIIMIPTPPNG
jgi:hypothetical protein